MIHVSSVRLGHANNSSSSHSILLNSVFPEHTEYTYIEEAQFGREWFHLKTTDHKARYLAALLFSALHDLHPAHRLLIVKELTGVDFYKDYDVKKDILNYPYVDHQSVFQFPLEHGHHAGVNHEFMKEFVEYVKNNPRISILGGSDESDETDDDYPFKGIKDTATQPLAGIPDNYRQKLVAVKDKDWWVIYNKTTGAKVRISFLDSPKPYKNSSRPELVDLKITDKCYRSCPFCYQSSKSNGKEATLNNIKQIIWALQEAKVFEVALGGGEPTCHPEFNEILSACKWGGITPNFSTGDTSWMEDPKIADAVKECCGSFAVSDLYAIDTLVKWNLERKDTEPEGVLQIPLGCHPEKTIKRSIETCVALHIPFTLLGFKNVGRASSFKVIDYSWIVSFLNDLKEDLRFRQYGADSLFVKEFKNELIKSGIDSRLMIGKEGAFSCYIDAVELKIGPSSYSDDMRKLGKENILKDFPFTEED